MTKPIYNNQFFILPRQPAADDRRPRNAFGFLLGFGEAYSAYYNRRAGQERFNALYMGVIEKREVTANDQTASS